MEGASLSEENGVSSLRVPAIALLSLEVNRLAEVTESKLGRR